MKFTKLLYLLIVLPLLLAACSAAPLAPAPTASPQASEEMTQARETLTRFFSLMAEGQYAEANGLYGGDYEVLGGFSPNAPALDEVENESGTLLESACKTVLRCLAIRNIVSEEQLSPEEFSFVVEFANEDGSLFERGPCCGSTEEEMPTVSQFTYTVRNVNGALRVIDPPVYVP